MLPLFSKLASNTPARSRTSVLSPILLFAGSTVLGIAALAGTVRKESYSRSRSQSSPIAAVQGRGALSGGSSQEKRGRSESRGIPSRSSGVLTSLQALPQNHTTLQFRTSRLSVAASPIDSGSLPVFALYASPSDRYRVVTSEKVTASRLTAPASNGVMQTEVESHGNLPATLRSAISPGSYVGNASRNSQKSNAGNSRRATLPPQLALTRLRPTGATTYTWVGATSDWGVASNWGGTVPGSGGIANFSATGNTAPTLASASQSVGGLTFTSDAQGYTISGNGGYSLTIGSGGITQASSNLQSISVSSLVLGADQTWNVGSGGLTVSAPISGSASLTKTGSGTLTLTDDNTYTGLTTVTAGTLNLNASFNGSSTYGATLSTNSIGLLINGGGTVNLAQSFQIPQNLPVTLADSSGSAATLNFTNAYTQLNTLNLGNGALVTGSGDTNGSYSAALILIDNTTTVGSIADGTTTVTSGVANATIRVPLGIQNSANFSVGAGSTLTISSSVTDWYSHGALIKSGAGTLILTDDANAYSGGTTISAGTLQIGDGSTTNGSTSGDITDNAALIFDNLNAFSYGNIISGTGSLTKTGSGMLTLTNIGNSLGSSVYFDNGTTLLIGSTSDFYATLNNGGDAYIGYSTGDNGTFTVSGTNGSGGASTWTSNGNLYVGFQGTGALNVTNGGSVLSGEGDIATSGSGTVTVSGTGGGIASTGNTQGNGLFVGKGSAGTLNVTSGGYVTTGTGTITLSSGASSSSTLIVNGGNLTTNVLSAGNGSTPTVKLTNPTSAINGSLYALNLGGSNGSSTIGFAISDAASGDGASGNIAGGQGGAGGIAKTGTGTLTLTGASTYSGGTLIAGGMVVASGGTVSGSTLTHGPLGTGAVTIASGGTLSVGEAANSGMSAISTGTLAIDSLSLAASTSAPELTFNLGASGTNDILMILSGGSNAFAAAGAFEIGFASATGQTLGSGTYTLMTFVGQTSTANLPSLSSYKASGTGNTSDVVNPLFSYMMNGGQETLVFSDAGTDATPEPASLLLLAPAALGLAAYRRRGKRAS